MLRTGRAAFLIDCCATIRLPMACVHCDDTGWKPIDDPTTGVRRVVRCECWVKQVGYDRLASANIPRRYQHCTFDNFLAYNESLERALESCRRVIGRYRHAPDKDLVGRGILLEG